MSGGRAVVVLEGNSYYPEDGVHVLAVILGAPGGLSVREIERAVFKKFGERAWSEIVDTVDVLEFKGPKWEIEDVPG